MSTITFTPTFEDIVLMSTCVSLERKGRSCAGWFRVTLAGPHEALNFVEPLALGGGYAHTVCTGSWTSDCGEHQNLVYALEARLLGDMWHMTAHFEGAESETIGVLPTDEAAALSQRLFWDIAANTGGS